MDIYYAIKQILKESGVKMVDLQRELGGITLQSLNESLHGNMKVDRLEKILDRCGYILMIGRKEGGRAVAIRTIEQLEREWKKK